jgi:hypothetical protein
LYPAAKASGLIQAPTKAVFDVLRREAGSNDPLGCFGQHVYYPRPSDKTEQVKYVLKPAKRRVLETYDAHTRIEQVVYKMTNDHGGGNGGNGGNGGGVTRWCSVVPAREFVSINHWRVVSETEHTVVVLNFGTTCMDEVLSNDRNNNDNSDNSDNNDDDDDSDSVRGECYGGWMLHPTNNGACTLVTRLVVLDMKMFTPSLERNVVNGVRAP